MREKADRNHNENVNFSSDTDRELDRQAQGEGGSGALPEAVVGQVESPMTGGGPRNPRTRMGGRDMPPKANPDQDPELEIGRAGGDDFYDDNTRIKRETQFRDATGHPLDSDAGGRRVTEDDDLFRREEDS